MATAPTPAAPQKAPGSPIISADATVYAEVPQIQSGELVGVLVGIGGELKGKVYKIHEGETRLGRGQDCDIQLLDAQISREHALIVCEDGALAILPLQDKNPIVVGDEDVDEGAELSDGNLVRFGNPGASTFRFRTIEGQ
jgi:pSer/pThr/pTyr-binding forkhead associated (FHA) protein